MHLKIRVLRYVYFSTLVACLASFLSPALGSASVLKDGQTGDNKCT
jgi:hypothetical protein